MEQSLKDLIDRLNQLSDQFQELREGVLRAVHIADEDPEMALIRARKVLEYLVRDVFVRRVGEPPGTRPLENLIQRLVKDGHFPPRLEAYTETIRKLGNVGAHYFGERISAADVYQSLTQLMPILEWYFEVERPDAGVHFDVPPHAEVARAVPPPAGQQAGNEVHVPVVPKGLRSFDANDSEFFLQLLPGPRDKDGLPESIRFWKHRIEATDDLSFTVGVIYGPSGCGKSSLVKAGLLPRLARRVVQTSDEVRQSDEQNRKEGYIPVDVAGYVVTSPDGKPTSRFAALWAQRTGPNDDAQMVLAPSAAELTKLQVRLKNAGLVPLTLHAWQQADDKLSYSGVWHKMATGTPGTPSSQSGLLEADLRVIAQQAGPLIDLGVFAAPPLPSTKERATATLQAAGAALKAKPDDLNARFARASAYFQLGENQKAIDDLNVVIQKAPQFGFTYQYRAIAHARLGHKDQARANLERFQKGNVTESQKLYLAVIVAVELGDGTDKEFEALETMLKKHPQDSLLHYNAACAYALASQALAGKDQAKRRELAERAIHLLRTAIQNGYADYKHMQEDTDLNPLRELPAFSEIMKEGLLDRSYAAVWAGDVRFEASPLLGLDPSTHLQRCRELASQGYRMVSLSVARTSPEGSAITASVWHRPVITEETKDQLAERQARAAIALLRMGKVAEVMPLLCHSADPRLRSFIVNWLRPLEADPKTLAAELDRLPATAKPTTAEGQQFMDAVLFHPGTSMRRALILALGTYGTEGLSPGEREPLIAKFLDLYRKDPDAGIHGAASWTLRQWGQQEKLQAADTELMKLKDRGDRRWYVNSQGQTFAVIDGPVEFRMGSPLTEPDRIAGSEIPHRRIIPRRFAVAAQEVSVEQYQAYMKHNPGVAEVETDYYSRDQKGPLFGSSWYHAADYCNWLSRQEGLPECYEPNPDGRYPARMKIKPDALRLGGYRLPTEAEWEYACRAGAGTSRYYGTSVDLLGQYAWYNATSREHAWPCGSLLPNELGLFDMLGNMHEWCQEVALNYQPDRNNIIIDRISDNLYVDDTSLRLPRGGSFYFLPASVRSAYRTGLLPASRFSNLGFRLSRTYR